MRSVRWIFVMSLAACGGVTSPNSSGGDGGARPVGQIVVGNDYFRSARNGSENPAVDTIAAGGSVTWTWDAEGSHSIQSIGLPGIFRNSIVLLGPSYTYTVTLSNPGTYSYDCGVHGAVMTGVIVVQ